MGFGISFVDEMYVVGAYEFYVVFACYAYQFGVDAFLYFEYGMICPRHGGFVSLQFYIIVISEDAFEPFGLAFGFLDFSGLYEARQFPAEACRANNKSFVVFLQLEFVGTRVGIKTLCPALRHEFDQIVVADCVFCKYDEMASGVSLVGVFRKACIRHIHLAAEYRFEI